MELSELEDLLFQKLSGPRMGSQLHLYAVQHEAEPPLDGVIGVGLDTNVLKLLRRDPLRADALLVKLIDAKLEVIVPGQVVVEFWNNHHVFAREDWNQFGTALAKLKKKLAALAPESDFVGRLAEMEDAVSAITNDLQESQSMEYLAKSRTLMESLMPLAIRPMVSRSRFAELSNIRHYSKTPPGFSDAERKSAALGDFFVWCDFLLGALTVTAKHSSGEGRFIWVTEESKPDWKTGSRGHPSLLEEFEWVCDSKLSMATLQDLEALMKPRRPSGPETGQNESL